MDFNFHKVPKENNKKKKAASANNAEEKREAFYLTNYCHKDSAEDK